MEKEKTTGKTWLLYPQDREKQSQLVENLNISPFLAQILVNRGITGIDEARKFLEPDISFLNSPYLMEDMEKAVIRTLDCIEEGGKIAIFGDYDVDGVTATALLYSLLNFLGANVTYYLPQRLTEGYGLSKSAVDFLREQEVSLIITVDCGINAVEEVEHALEFGIDVIITDHHHPGENLPDASAVINPLREDCSYPFKELCGAGVAFKYGQALLQYLEQDQQYNFWNKNNEQIDAIWSYLDLVALGTVADVVPLVGENRIFAAQGLRHMKSFLRPGLEALCEVAGLEIENLTAERLAFILAPRLNAAGRLGDAETSFKLLIEEEKEAALELATKLQRENSRRQAMEAQIFIEARDMAEKQQKEGVGTNFLVLASENWHYGILGIVASRMVEKFNVPVILIALDGEVGKGSGRSIKGFDIYQALKSCSSLLLAYGGHYYAAGLTLNKENIALFRENLELLAQNILEEREDEIDFYIDAILQTGDISPGLAHELEKLQPFGYGNPRPMFYSENWLLENVKEVGKGGQHLKFHLRKSQQLLEAISFNGKDTLPQLEPFREIAPVFTLSLSRWKGKEQLQMEVSYFFYCDEYNNSHVSLIDRRELEKKTSKISYLKELLSRENNVLVFVNTTTKINKLKELFRGWGGISFSHQGNLFCSERSKFHDLVLYDLPLRKGNVLKLIDNLFTRENGGVKIHLLYGSDDYQANLTLLLATVPLPASLEQIYHFLQKLSKDDVLFRSDVFKKLPALVSFPVTNTLIEKSLAILQEAMYLEFQQEQIIVHNAHGKEEEKYCSFLAEISRVEKLIEEKKKWQETLAWQKLLLDGKRDKLISSILPAK